MKKSHLGVALVAGFLTTALFVSLASAQQPQAQPRAAAPAQRPLGIALLDVNAIFKDHPGFKARMAQLEQTVKTAENQVKAQKDEIRQLAEQLKEMREGSPEYQQYERRLAERQANLQASIALQKKDFLQQEAKIYHSVYQEIEQEVSSFAQAYNIAVVLRYSGDPVDAEKPDEILRDINKSVVYSAQGLDITGQIRDRLKQRMPAGAAPAAYPPAGPNAMRPGVPQQPGAPQQYNR